MQEYSKKMSDENCRKLIAVVVILLLFVFALFSLAPST